MKTALYDFEVLTAALAGGADPKARAEIRPASIRGQLRWWFRTLGGFRSQANTRLRLKEAAVFGSIQENHVSASPLVVRVVHAPPCTPPKTMADLGAPPFSEKGYLLWPLREDGRSTIPAGSRFQLQILWKGPDSLWPDIQALLSVFAHLGSLGFRSRRAMGALTSPAAGSLPEALNRFASPQNISIRCMDAASAEDAMSKAGGWLRSWRAHGRTGNNPDEQLMPGFKWAKHDHDLGAGSLGHAHIYRAALGMPIVQRFTSSKSKTVTWTPREGERLASPVLLRPHKSGNQWLALFVFIHCQELPENTPVVGKTVGGRDGAKLSARISSELLLQMQNDERLRSF